MFRFFDFRCWHGLAAGVLLVWAVESSAVADTRKEADALLARCLETQGVTDKIRFKATVEVHMTSPEDRPLHHLINLSAARDGKRVDIAGFYELIDRDAESSHRWRSVLNKDLLVSYQIPLQDFKAGKKPKSGSATKQVETGFLTAVGVLYHTFALDGYFPNSDGKRLAQLARECADLHVRGTERIAASECTVVEGRGPYGSIALWIAPDRGFLPLKVTYEKISGDLLLAGQKVSSDMIMTHLPGRPGLAGGLCALTEVEVVRQGDTFLTVGGKLTQTVRATDGQETVDDLVMKRTQLTVKPRFDRSDFAIDLEDGCRITNQDDRGSGVVYIWKDGNVVVADPEFGGEPVPLMPKGQSRFFWIWGLVGLACLLVSALAVLVHRKAKANPR